MLHGATEWKGVFRLGFKMLDDQKKNFYASFRVSVQLCRTGGIAVLLGDLGRSRKGLLQLKAAREMKYASDAGLTFQPDPPAHLLDQA
jgi:hypothetical protein